MKTTTIKKIEDLNKYIKVKENGCMKWTGGHSPSIIEGGKKSAEVIFNEELYCPQNLIADIYQSCEICLCMDCFCDNREYLTVGTSCGYYECLNKNHFIISKGSDFFNDYKIGITIEELSKKYGQPIDLVISWLEGEDLIN